MQNNSVQKPPNITNSLSRAFIQPENSLILHSQGLDILPALAESLYSSSSHLTILINFDPIQIRQLNHHLQQLKQEKIVMKSDTRSDKPQIYTLNKIVKEKREKLYISGGIYALTLQIMLLDCLSQGRELNVQGIDCVLIKQGSGLGDGYGLISWLTTLLSLDRNKTIIRLVSSKPTIFKGDNLQKIMRQLYIKKLILWPFGRSQIHKCLQQKQLTNRNHKLPLNNLQQQLHINLLKLLRYSQKNEHDKNQVNYLLNCLLNYSKIDFLVAVHKIVNDCTQYSIWKSSNTSVIELVDSVVKVAKSAVFSLLLQVGDKGKENGQIMENGQIGQNQQKVELCRQIDLNKLLPTTQPQNSTSSPILYKLHYNLHVTGLEQNSRQNSPLFSSKLLQIIRSVKEQCQLYFTPEQNYQPMIDEEELIERVMSQKLEKIIQQSRSQKQKNSCVLEKQIMRGGEDQGDSDVFGNRSLDEVDKTSSNKQELCKKQIQFAQFSLDKYQYQKQEKNKKIVSLQIFDNKRASMQTIQQQREMKQEEKQQKENEKKENKQKQAQNLIPDTFPQFQITNSHLTQIQRIVYISTDSKQLTKLIHQSMYIYEKQLHYIAYLQKLLQYLQQRQEQRISSIKRTIKKLSNPNNNSKNNKIMLHLEHEPILLQEFYLELKAVYSVVAKYSVLKDYKQRDQLFLKELARMQLRYVDKQGLKLWVDDYSSLDDCCLWLKGTPKVKVRFCIKCSQTIPQINQNLRVLLPHSIYFYSPKTSLIRHLNIAYSQQFLYGVEAIHTVYFNNSIQSEKVVKIVKEQDEAFWGIAQERKKLGQYSENPEVRIKQLIIDDDIEKKARMISLATSTQAKNARNQLPLIRSLQNFRVQRTVLIDKRQFKSLLPSYLFHNGFKVIPVFLEHADYIISNDIGIQKKSVHTRDLHESLRSGRLNQQLKYLSLKFAKPYLLIQCPDISHFKKQQFNFSYSKVTGEKYSFNVRKQLVPIMNRYPKVNIIWSKSYSDTIKYFIELKKNKEEPDISKFNPQNDQNQLEILQEQPNQEQPDEDALF